MAVAIEGRFTAPADRETVWAKLNDPAVLRSCILGCETFEQIDATHFAAVLRLKAGPLSAAVKARLELQDVDAPNGCRLVAEGQGGLAGFAKGAATVRLLPVPEGTAVTYVIDGVIGGRVAKLGGWLLDGLAKRMADRFFSGFVAAVGPAPKRPN